MNILLEFQDWVVGQNIDGPYQFGRYHKPCNFSYWGFLKTKNHLIVNI